MFYIAWIVCVFLLCIESRNWIFNDNYFEFIFTILGIDGWMQVIFKTSTWFIVGEWFTGLIIILYIIYPLLFRFTNNKKQITIMYGMIILAWLISFLLIPSSAKFTPFGLLPAFLFGVLFVKLGYIDKIKLQSNKKKILISCFCIFCLFILSLINYLIPFDLKSIVICIILIILLFEISYIQGAEKIEKSIVGKIIMNISRYSYAIFLIHHIILYQLLAYIQFPNNKIGTLYIFIMYASTVYIASCLLYVLTKNIVHRRRLFTG